MKPGKKLAVVFLTAVLSVAAFALSSCDNETEVGAVLVESNQSLVVIQATATGGSVEDAIKKFKNEGDLDYDGTTDEYGLYVASVNGYTVTGNEYWAVYTSLGEYNGVAYSDLSWGSYEYDGVNCASASYGVTYLPLVEGEIYILAISTY